MLPGKSTAEEVSFEWSHHRISSTDSKVRTALRVSRSGFESESVRVTEKKHKEINATEDIHVNVVEH